MIVVDASAVLEVLLRSDTGKRLEERLLTGKESLYSPHVLDLEVAQVLRRFAAAGELRAERGREALADLEDPSLAPLSARLPPSADMGPSAQRHR